jgi:hypothetical protein
LGLPGIEAWSTTVARLDPLGVIPAKAKANLSGKNWTSFGFSDNIRHERFREPHVEKVLNPERLA